MSDQANVTDDFIFGTMATDDLRLAHLTSQARGVAHLNDLTPIDPRPGDDVVLTVRVGPDVAPDAVTAWYTLDGSDPDISSAALAFAPVATEWDTLIWGYRQVWQATLPGQPNGTLVSYRIAATTAGNDLVWADPDPDTGPDSPATLFAFHVDDERIPDWARDAVIYHVFVDRFNPGAGHRWRDAPTLNDIWGGTIRGVTEKLPYLADLGATCIWLSPVFPSPTHHGYDATDYRTVEPRLGTAEDLRELFRAAHAAGMRVILDFVASHMSNVSAIFREASESIDSPYRRWFTFRDDNTYRAFFGVPEMPQIEVDDLAARRFLIDAATYWLEQGADGFRLDYANGPSHAFWSAFRAGTRTARADSFTVGEVVESASLQRSYEGRLDGTLDFLLLQQFRAFFGFDLITPAAFDTFLARHLEWFDDRLVLPTFLDNHDMNRFLWVVQGDVRRLMLAAICQFTLPHPPIVYYGTEVGVTQRHDLEYPDGSRRMEESRTPMLWGDDQDEALRTFYRDLIHVRRDHPALWRAARKPLVRSDDGLYVVELSAPGGERAVVALNRGPVPQTVTLPDDLLGATVALLTDDRCAAAGDHLVVPGWAGCVLIGRRSA